MVKCLGAEWNRFYNDKEWWPENTFHDDAYITINGMDEAEDDDLSKIPDDASVSVTGGAVYHGEYSEDAKSLESYFKAWRKKQSTVTMIVEAPREKEDAVREAIKAAGGKAR